MDSNTSSPTSTYWMIWPSEALSEELPREMLLPNRVARVKVIVTPTIRAITTPARKYAESLSALGAVTKMIADMICGPAFIVMARGMTDRLIALIPPGLGFLRRSGGHLLAEPARSVAPAPNRLCDRGCRRGAAGR